MENKPLLIHEQSMLLVAILFASHSLDDILQFFPEKPKQRMRAKAFELLKLPKQQRISLAIFELKRLFLYQDNALNLVHKTWIDSALYNEPLYIKNLIQLAMQKNNDKNEESKFISLALQCFTNSFIKYSVNKPFFDPVLTRINTINKNNQLEIFENIGKNIIAKMSEYYNKKRFSRFMQSKGIILTDLNEEKNIINIMSNQAFRSWCLSFSLKNTKILSSLTIAVLAVYLYDLKYSWQYSSIMMLDKSLGMILNKALDELKDIKLNIENKVDITKYLYDIFGLNYLSSSSTNL